jgi:TPR repeat protein
MKRWLMISLSLAACAVAGIVGIRYLARPAAESAPAAKAEPINLGELQSRAQAGDAKAQVQLGHLYVKGEGVTNSYAEAAKWFRRAADQTNSEALLSLGELYEAGQGVRKDLDQAIKLYRQAAEQGNANGQYTLAFMYESGRGVPQNHVEAAKWFQRAAERGQALAQYDLGQRYNLGVGVPADKVEGLKWLILAAAQGQPDAAEMRDKVQRELSRAQVTEARRRAAAVSTARVPTQ